MNSVLGLKPDPSTRPTYTQRIEFICTAAVFEDSHVSRA